MYSGPIWECLGRSCCSNLCKGLCNETEDGRREEKETAEGDCSSILQEIGLRFRDSIPCIFNNEVSPPDGLRRKDPPSEANVIASIGRPPSIRYGKETVGLLEEIRRRGDTRVIEKETQIRIKHVQDLETGNSSQTRGLKILRSANVSPAPRAARRERTSRRSVPSLQQQEKRPQK